MRKVSSFFPAVSKELHVSLSNVENVKEMEKMKVLAAAKEVSENVKRAKILENYNSSNQLRKQRRLEDSQNAREFDPETAAIDDITFQKFRERSSILIRIEPSLRLEIQKTRIRITAMLKRVKILQQFKPNILQQLHYQ